MTRLAAILGIVTLAAAWFAPVPGAAAHSFSMHMARHMAVVAVAAPLLAAATAGARLDPVRAWPRLFAPIPASILELVVVWAWHTPLLHGAARNSAVVFGLEQASFLFAGLLLWSAALGGDTAGRVPRRAAGAVGLLFTSMHMTLLGALFTLSPRPLYGSMAHGWGPLTALQDMHLGGTIMLLAGGASYLVGGLFLMRDVLRAPALAGGSR